MKTLITILILFVATGCLREVEPETQTVTETENTEKPLSPEEKLVGSYEAKIYGNVVKAVFHENGKSDHWMNGQKEVEGTWKLVEKEVHIKNTFFEEVDIEEVTDIHRIESNGDLTVIAVIKNGKRKDIPKEDQIPFKKVK